MDQRVLRVIEFFDITVGEWPPHVVAFCRKFEVRANLFSSEHIEVTPFQCRYKVHNALPCPRVRQIARILRYPLRHYVEQLQLVSNA